MIENWHGGRETWNLKPMEAKMRRGSENVGWVGASS